MPLEPRILWVLINRISVKIHSVITKAWNPILATHYTVNSCLVLVILYSVSVTVPCCCCSVWITYHQYHNRSKVKRKGEHSYTMKKGNLPYDPAISICNICPKDSASYLLNNIHSYFLNSQWKQLKGALKMWHVCTKKSFSIAKKNEIIKFTGK